MKYEGKCYNRENTEFGIFTQKSKNCQLSGCSGLRLGVLWSNNKITWPCSKGLKNKSKNIYQIL